MVGAMFAHLCAPHPARGRDTEESFHGRFVPVSVYLNDVACAAFEARAQPRERPACPIGSAMVKEKLDGEGRSVGVGGMVKDQDGVWRYSYREPDGEVVTGRTASCAQCHAGAPDEVYGGWAQGPLGALRGGARRSAYPSSSEATW